jgi:general transcriptional corepressor TUP1
MQPTPTMRSNTVTGPAFSVVDSLDSIKQEYQSLHTELIKVRSERDELELKRTWLLSPSVFSPPSLSPSFTSGSVESQVTEMVTIRRSLFDLENQHERAHNHYEDEIKRIRAELVAARQSGTAPAVLGIPGRTPRQLALSVPLPNTPAMSETQSSLRHRPPNDRERDTLERELRDRPRDPVERDLDRVSDRRDTKRHKTRQDYSGWILSSTHNNPVLRNSPFSRSSTFSKGFKFC